MKVAVCLLVCFAATLALAADEDVAVTEEAEFSSRKLLDYKSTPKFCSPHDHVITCKGYNEYCKLLVHPICKKERKCDRKKVCVRHDYRSGGHGYYKRKVKVCVKYDYKTSCYYKNVCHKYACARRH